MAGFTIPRPSTFPSNLASIEQMPQACSKRTLPPDAYLPPPDLTGSILYDPANFPRHHTSGGYSDVYKCFLRHPQGHLEVVAVKVPRYGDGEVCEKQRKLYRREIKTCKWLNHENIIPLLGTINSVPGPYPCLVFPWAKNGTLTEYLKRQGPDFPLHRRLRIMVGVTNGLSYLHGFGVVHGDLSGSNVLIDEKHTAKLADFGLSNIKMEFKGTSYFTFAANPGAIRWMAPEFVKLDQADRPPLEVARPQDIYSLGMVFLQVITGKIPFSNFPANLHVVVQLLNDTQPQRPEQISDDHWEFIQRCWSLSPEERPDVDAALETVTKFYLETNAEAVISEEEDDGIPSAGLVGVPHNQDINLDGSCLETFPVLASAVNAALFGAILPLTAST